MKSFLRLLQHQRCPSLPIGLLEKKVSIDTLHALRCEGVVVPGGRAEWWPCGSGSRSGCVRRIVPAPEGSPRVDAVCGAEDIELGCQNIRLNEEQLATYTTSIPNLLDLLRRLFGLEAGPGLRSNVVDHVHALGTGIVGTSPTPRHVAIALAPLEPSFEAFLLLRQQGRVDTLVLIPSASWMSPDLLEHHGPGARVEVQPLEELLAIHRGRVVVVRAADGSVRSSPVASSEPPERPYCRLYDRDGSRTIDGATYSVIVSGREHDFVLDVVQVRSVIAKIKVKSRHGNVTRTKKVRGYLARWPQRREQECPALARNEAMVLAELMAMGRPMAPGEFTWVGVKHRDKLVERARRKVEGPLGRSAWLLFHTEASEKPDANQYRFRPPPDFRYAVLMPLKYPSSPDESDHETTEARRRPRT